MLRTLIVDDERLAREELKYVLKEYRNVEVVGLAGHGKEALELNENLKVTKEAGEGRSRRISP